ncbi:type I restriction endonuclease [Rickettsia sp. 2024-CO-Wats]|uniref:type I restriction endonuclease n=1 Tax=unclassified Rickettsia TaxID=114295 RepID=UPI00370D7D03
MECKSPIDSLDQAISQHIRNQKSDVHLFHYAQLLIVINKNEAKYAAVGRSDKYWRFGEKREKKQNINIIRNLINKPLTEEVKNLL